MKADKYLASWLRVARVSAGLRRPDVGILMGWHDRKIAGIESGWGLISEDDLARLRALYGPEACSASDAERHPSNTCSRPRESAALFEAARQRLEEFDGRC